MRPVVLWSSVLAGWTLIAVVFAASSSLTYMLTYQPPRWDRTLATALAEWYPWAALTPLVVWLGRRFRLRRRRWGRQLFVLVPAGLIVAFLKLALTQVARTTLGVAEYIEISNFTTQYLIYCGLIGGVHAAQNYQDGRERELRASQLEASLADARLQLLKMQLQPHFLFNTLNAIAELVHEDPIDAERMIGGLSGLLRDTLDVSIADRVPLSRELQLLARYVDIQRVRFGDRLQVRVDVEAGVDAALIPPLILQPLIENSIKYGVSARRAAGHIDVRARREANSLVVEVRDDGEGFDPGDVKEGVGLGNTRHRLAELFGKGHKFEIDRIARDQGGGSIIRVTVPWQTAPPVQP